MAALAAYCVSVSCYMLQQYTMLWLLRSLGGRWWLLHVRVHTSGSIWIRPACLLGRCLCDCSLMCRLVFLFLYLLFALLVSHCWRLAGLKLANAAWQGVKRCKNGARTVIVGEIMA